MVRRLPLPEERQARIIDLLTQQEFAALGELQAASRASEATTRRDLSELARRGVLERTHGGARLMPRDSSLDEEFSHRRRRNARAKRSIASSAADLVPDGALLFLNDGTTTFALAQELSMRNRTAWIATSALNIAEMLARNSSFDVVVIGGSLRRTSFGTIGPLATGSITGLHADLAFIGCDGIHIREGIRSNSLYDAEVARAMANHADRVIAVADSSKYGGLARVRVVGWEGIDDLITDSLPADARKAIQERNVRVRLSSSS